MSKIGDFTPFVNRLVGSQSQMIIAIGLKIGFKF